MSNPLLLSTKKLHFHQLERLMAARCNVIDYNAIRIENQPFSITEKPNYWVFSSQNAVHSFLANPTAKQYDKPILCVGEKTKSLLEENGRKVIKTAQNIQKLVVFIEKNMKMTIFCIFVEIENYLILSMVCKLLPFYTMKSLRITPIWFLVCNRPSHTECCFIAPVVLKAICKTIKLVIAGVFVSAKPQQLPFAP